MDHRESGAILFLIVLTRLNAAISDDFGSREEVSSYKLSPRIDILWLADGNHDLIPRKSVSGYSAADHLEAMAEAVSAWAERVTTQGD